MLFSLTSDPPDPAPGQGIVANVDFGCVHNYVRIEVVGTDGHTDSIKCENLDGSRRQCGLHIPGAAANVQDNIKVYCDNGWFSSEKFWRELSVVC